MSESSMVLIRHGIRFAPAGGTPLPVGTGFLTTQVIRQAVAILIGNNVQRFNDGHFHATANTYALDDLLAGFSEADAVMAGFEVINDEPSKKFLFAGLRWEVNLRETDVKIFGPKSNPESPYVINLLNE